MKNFDMNRFALALKCQLLSTRRQWLRLFGILTLAMFVMDIFFTRISYQAYERTFEEFGLDSVRHFYEHIISQTAGIGIFILFGAMLFGACYVFSHLKETRQRTTYLMWPVSNLEKFLVCMVQSIVLMGVGTIVSYMLADSMRLLLDLITGRVLISGIPMFFEVFVPKNAPAEAVFAICCTQLFLHSCYILGGSLFRRRQFLLTSLAMVILSFFLTWVSVNLLDVIGIERTMIFISENRDWNVEGSVIACGCIVLLLTALNYWLSYKIFCRMQVINNKWLNL